MPTRGNEGKEPKMTTKKQLTKAEVKQNGKRICFRGGDEVWVCEGIAFLNVIRDGYEINWLCLGKASKAARVYGFEL